MDIACVKAPEPGKSLQSPQEQSAFIGAQSLSRDTGRQKSIPKPIACLVEPKDRSLTCRFYPKAPPDNPEGIEPEGIEEAQVLLGRLAQGDSAAFWGLWDDHQKYLYDVCLRNMRGVPEDAEEALSRVMFRAWGKLPNYASEITNIKAWLIKLTYNLCMDIHRERKRQVLGIKSVEDKALADSWPASSIIQSPEQALLSGEMYAHINSAIDSLPNNLREPFNLRFFEQMPYQEIAKVLTLSIVNVRKRIQKARAILRQRLNDYHDK